MALQHWKRLSESVIFEHPRLTVYEDRVVLPDGTETDYLHFGTEKTMTSVGIIAIREDGKILIQKELSYPVGEFIWQWPGGKSEPGESLEEAVNRELMEEASLRANTITPLGKVHWDNRKSGSYQVAVVATGLEKADLPSDIEESFEYAWMAETEIDQLIADGAVTNALCLAEWALFKAQRK